MTGPMPDGMGADRYRERENMKEARQPVHTPEWELRALNQNGRELYRTESFDSHEDAHESAQELNEGELPDNIDDSVAMFEPVRKDE
jgi:hypothetical protein